ncbi:helix-turn-helix domain-containing protein [Ruminococcus gauvreauii]|uniref:helix-turn-helix domain-containing protein n=1 Tax=Ruminococcus gauvreauii TaxID=438033 RepID=UPI0039846161
MIDEINFGKRLEECMKSAGYNNSKITKELNLSKNAIGNYKNNQIPNATILYNLSQKLGTTMEYLLTGKNKQELTEEEQNILNAYKSAPDAIKTATKKLLDITDTGKLSNSKIG